MFKFCTKLDLVFFYRKRLTVGMLISELPLIFIGAFQNFIVKRKIRISIFQILHFWQKVILLLQLALKFPNFALQRL